MSEKDPCTKPALMAPSVALARLYAQVAAPSSSESVPLLRAQQRVLAETITSTIAVPQADNSAMDGYAFAFSDFSRLQQEGLPVSQRIPAGKMPLPLQHGTVARIFTGALLPEGADTVIPQEQVVLLEATKVQANAPVVAGQHVRPRGDDVCEGQVILEAGTRLGVPQLGMLATVGCAEVSVYRRLQVALFSTGDELRNPGEALQHAAEIYNSNRVMLLAALEQAGFLTLDLGTLRDNRAETEATLQKAAMEADVVLSTGGASVGEEDHLKAALEAQGSVDFWNIAIKPGKPVMFGRVEKTPVIGLPGNPVSAFFTFHYFVLPFLRALQGEKLDATRHPAPYFWVTADFSTNGKEKRLEFLRARLLYENNEPKAVLYPNQSSGVLSSVAWADGLVEIPPQTAIQRGQKVAYWPFYGFLG